MQYEGMIYRPPSEARSLIIQATVGCSHNRCSFCTMYKDKIFRIRSREEIFRDLEEMAGLYGRYPIRIFLADGDALGLKMEFLLEILKKIRDLFPYADRVTVYGSARNVLEKTTEELAELRDSGLAMVYMGAESGDDGILKRIRKDVTAEEMILAGQRLKEAEIALSLTLIAGLGGRERMQEHALASAALVTAMKPEFVGYLTLMLEKGCQMEREVRSGEMQLLLPDETLEELMIFLSHTDAEGCVFRANHASNYLRLKGTLNRDIPSMLSQIRYAREEKRFKPENWRAL